MRIAASKAHQCCRTPQAVADVHRYRRRESVFGPRQSPATFHYSITPILQYSVSECRIVILQLSRNFKHAAPTRLYLGRSNNRGLYSTAPAYFGSAKFEWRAGGQTATSFP